MTEQKSTVVIPCAGKGTRLYPLTKDLSKSLINVGSYRMIDYSISECIAGNIDRIVFVLSPDDDQLMEHIHSVNNNKNIPGINKNEFVDIDCKIVEQKLPLGLGNAIYLAADYILGDSFGIILPDDLILHRNSVINKMKSIYSRYNRNILYGKYISEELIENFGIIETGSRYENLYLVVNKLLEKPNKKDTDSNLAILGRYYLNVKIFDYLHNLEPGFGGEIQLTDALSKMLPDDQFIVIESGDYHFDVGNLKGLELAERYINNNPL